MPGPRLFLHVFAALAFLSPSAAGREGSGPLRDKCGNPVAGATAKSGSASAPPEIAHWGYGYDSLLADLGRWSRLPFVRADSVGASGQGRALWMLTVSETPAAALAASVPEDEEEPRARLFVHARTHPQEVQTSWLVREMMGFLSDSLPEAREMRRRFVVNIIPMLNPDGVVAESPRRNANDVDLESNWDKPVLEPEVQALKGVFDSLMGHPLPIRVALNLHSDQFNCTRFFFFHHADGTSERYVELQKDFIAKVRGRFPAGIEPWHFVVSWQGGTGRQYPEGYFWSRHGDSVLALTFEDANCPDAGDFDSTAQALLLGARDYVLQPPQRIIAGRAGKIFRLLRTPSGFRLYPPDNPPGDRWHYFDAGGRRRAGGEVLRDGRILLPRELRLLPGHLRLEGSPALPGRGTSKR